MTVGADGLEGFDRAENPDGNNPFASTVALTLEMLNWSIRVVGQQLAAHPGPATLAVALVLVGSLSERIVPLPEPVRTVLLLAGNLGFAFVGSGRLRR